MKNFTYVDNSNVYIEGCRASAVKKRMAKDYIEAMEHNISDRSWQIDYGRLHEFACGERSEIGCAKLWGSPPPSDTFWDMVERKGFQVKTFERNFAGKEKKVDVAIAYQIAKDAYSGLINKELDEITLVAGDRDFVPVVEGLVSEGFVVHVVFWDNAAPELKAACTEFKSLWPFLDYISLSSADRRA